MQIHPIVWRYRFAGHPLHQSKDSRCDLFAAAACYFHAAKIPAFSVYQSNETGFSSLPKYSVCFPISEPGADIRFFRVFLNHMLDRELASHTVCISAFPRFSFMSQFSLHSTVTRRPTLLRRIKHSGIDSPVNRCAADMVRRSFFFKATCDLLR